MDDQRARTRATSEQRNINLVRYHRANDLIFGHLGRVSYIPSEDDDLVVGDLRFNRTTGRNPSLQEVSPFKTWYPAPGIKPPEDHRPQWQINRSQKIWLKKNISSAMLGSTDIIKSILAKENKTTPETETCDSGTALLSYGDITDSTRTRRFTGCLALAIADGEAGELLRIVKLDKHHARWPEDDQPSLYLATEQNTEEGHWCGEGAPISQVKFTKHQYSDTQMRWLLVQTPTSTRVIEPKLHRIPLLTQHSCGYMPRGRSTISVDPILTLKIDQTGGFSHSDVSFRSESAGRRPQLAIIDQGGNWTVWEIIGGLRLRNKNVHSALMFRGNILNGLESTAPSSGLSNGDFYRILWAPRERTSDFDERPPNSPSANSNTSVTEFHSEAGNARPLPANIIVCGRTVLRVISLQNASEHLALNLLPCNNQLDQILDLQANPLDATQIFVLTTATVFWVDLQAQVVRSAPSDKHDHSAGPAIVNTPTVLVSCPHLKGPSDATLKLSVSETSLGSKHNAILVMIYSSKNLRMSVFWFIAPELNSPANFHHQAFTFSFPNDSQGERLALRTLTILPTQLSSSSGRKSPDSERNVADNGLHFFQPIGLGTDLRLCAALCVTTPGQGDRIPPPEIRDNVSQNKHLRKEAIKHFGQSFVVSDDFDESTLLQEVLATNRPEKSPTSRRWSPLEMLYILNCVSMKTSSAIEGVYKTIIEDPDRDVLAEVRELIEVGISEEYLPYGTLLSIVDDQLTALLPDDTTNSKWESLLEALQANGGERLQVINLSRDGAGPGTATSPRALAELWSANLPQDALSRVAAHDRHILVGIVAQRLFLSEIGVQVLPQNLMTPASARADDTIRDSIRDSQPGIGLPTPSQTGSVAGSSYRTPTKAESSGSESEPEVEDDAVARLRQRGLSTNVPVPRKQKRSWASWALSHWELGTDPEEYAGAVSDVEGLLRDESARKRKEKTARNIRRAERLGLPVREAAGSASQPAARVIESSQVRAAEPSSQLSQGPGLSQTMSQPLQGTFGTRMKKKRVQKGKKAFGFK